MNSDCILHVAVKEKDYLGLKYMLENGADVNVEDKDNRTPLHTAIIEQSSEDIVLLLLKHGANVNQKDRYDLMPLHLAAESDDNLRIIQILVEHGAQLNATDIDGSTPLHLANVHPDNVKTIAYLIKHGADVTIRDKYDGTPLYDALYSGHVSNVAEMLDRGPNTYCDAKLIHNLLTEIPQGPELQEALEFLLKYLIRLGEFNFVSEEIWATWKPVMEELSEFAEACKNEAKKMRKTLISLDYVVTVADILVKKMTVMARYLVASELKRALSSMDFDAKFPIYAKLLKRRIEGVSKLANLELTAYESLRYILGDKRIPHTFLVEIMSYFDENDFRVLNSVCNY